MKPVPAFMIGVLALALGGCATWIAPLSDSPIDREEGHRTLGARVEDMAIEYKAAVNIRRDTAIPTTTRAVVVSWNGQVLVTGDAPDTDARARVGVIAGGVRHVRQVHEEMSVNQGTSRLERIRDAWTTARVKTRLLFTPDVPARRVKVVTDNGAVYLMGLLGQEEAAMVVSEVQKTAGVQKIVKIFEYLD